VFDGALTGMIHNYLQSLVMDSDYKVPKGNFGQCVVVLGCEL
jgi:hypothetical protein